MEDRNNTRDELDNMDGPKESEMYVMYVKDIITEQPASTVRGGGLSDGGIFFKTTKHTNHITTIITQNELSVDD
jgi:hypothetical protein